ncbi:hypothetical protein [Erythrobacter sp. THAF29]|uniref:hypothetical protein n=1 Tax=Erythrobacter sp. THAF29 TaxID=2587851 RepID=UPI001267ED9E|nr:hypothetical protein [Erythrobacter sp. THAF29]QFT78104.1 hypothetical protein FIU90_11195 [Erythrobacter sp. THAF29]
MTKPNLPARIIPDFTPVPRKRMRRGGWSADRQREFIELLAETGSVRSACRRMGVGEHHIYKLRRHPEAESFRKAWEAALDIGVQRIEDVAMDRALNGVEEPVYHRGEIVGTRRAYNDRLLMFMLERRAPERFGGGGGASDPGWKGRETARLAMKLRKEIREELEAEAKANAPTPEEIRASIDAKIEGLRLETEMRRQREWERLSEDTRAAWERFEQLRTRDMERIAAEEDSRRKLLAGPREAVNAEPGRKTTPPEPKVPETSWTLKDDSFDS